MSMRQFKITKSITNRESESVDRYLKEINHERLISPEEEALLTIRIRQGNTEALDQLVKANLRFVVSVAKQYQNKGLSLADLINEGNYGLIKAARMFDETKGFRFISYAVWWIRQSIVHAIADQAKVIRVPLNKTADGNKVRKTFALLEQEFERQPSADEIADHLQIEISDVVSVMEYSARTVSVDSPVAEGEDDSLIDILENPNATSTDKKVCHDESLKMELTRSLKSLTETQQRVICYYFGINTDRPVTLEDIGIRMNLTRERIRQIKDKALDKLRTTGNKDALRSFLYS